MDNAISRDAFMTENFKSIQTTNLCSTYFLHHHEDHDESFSNPDDNVVHECQNVSPFSTPHFKVRYSRHFVFFSPNVNSKDICCRTCICIVKCTQVNLIFSVLACTFYSKSKFFSIYVFCLQFEVFLGFLHQN